MYFDGTTYITNTEKQGSHWSLLVIDINNVTSYYCDSLSWPVSINIKGTVGCNLAIIEGDSGMSINNCLSSIRVVRPHNHTCTAICKDIILGNHALTCVELLLCVWLQS